MRRRLLVGATNERGWFYPSRLPTAPPDDGRVIAHNPVYPVARRQGPRGSRWWLQEPAEGLNACPCGWAPELGTHYAYVLPTEARHIRGAS